MIILIQNKQILKTIIMFFMQKYENIYFLYMFFIKISVQISTT